MGSKIPMAVRLLTFDLIPDRHSTFPTLWVTFARRDTFDRIWGIIFVDITETKLKEKKIDSLFDNPQGVDLPFM